MKRKALYICVFIFVVLFAVFYFYRNQIPDQSLVHQKCPDEYDTDDAGSAEYLADFDKWTNNFYNTHPGATVSEWAEARHAFWVENNCIAALQRYEEAKSGKVDPATMNSIKDAMKEAVGR